MTNPQLLQLINKLVKEVKLPPVEQPVWEETDESDEDIATTDYNGDIADDQDASMEDVTPQEDNQEDNPIEEEQQPLEDGEGLLTPPPSDIDYEEGLRSIFAVNLSICLPIRQPEGVGDNAMPSHAMPSHAMPSYSIPSHSFLNSDKTPDTSIHTLSGSADSGDYLGANGGTMFHTNLLRMLLPPLPLFHVSHKLDTLVSTLRLYFRSLDKDQDAPTEDKRGGLLPPPSDTNLEFTMIIF